MQSVCSKNSRRPIKYYLDLNQPPLIVCHNSFKLEVGALGMDGIILAGGKGNRMDYDLPKALVPVHNKPIIAHQLDYLLPHLSAITLALGHRAHEVITYVQQHYPHTSITFSVETEPLGTAGALRQAIHHTTSPYILVLNCDDLTNIDIRALQRSQENLICGAHPRLPFGRLIEHDRGVYFEEKPLLPDWVSAGWYVLHRATILPLLPEKGSLEYDIFPRLSFKLYKHEGYWHPLNSKKDISECENNPLPVALRSS